jgi:nicotinamidase/pyrazinamidase
MRTEDLRAGDGVLLVDVQIDFCPGGALPIPEGDQVVPILNEWVTAAERRRIPIYASRDWHPVRHPSFQAEGGRWPPHCIQDTEGAAFHPDLRLPPDVIKVTKGTRFDQDQYSAFDQTGLHHRLQGDGVRRLWVGGLAQDVCVCATALDARGLGYEVHLIPGGSLPVDRDSGVDALRRMREAGVVADAVTQGAA